MGGPSSSVASRAALVTIGRAIALRLARDGWAVAVNDVESARAAAVAAVWP
jgi:NAD(P)-dependent dehydrogenase (short-subunit alcohol dehydrogenase family)